MDLREIKQSTVVIYISVIISCSSNCHLAYSKGQPIVHFTYKSFSIAAGAQRPPAEHINGFVLYLV